MSKAKPFMEEKKKRSGDQKEQESGAGTLLNTKVVETCYVC
jgi:hypothetical protein